MLSAQLHFVKHLSKLPFQRWNFFPSSLSTPALGEIYSMKNSRSHFFASRSHQRLIRTAVTNIESLTSRQREQIHLYLNALLLWNQKMNLTAITDAGQAMERHVEDSLAILAPIQDSYTAHCSSSIDDISLVDIGTGAGLPGLILAIARPDWKVTLAESMIKRCTFLDYAVSVTGLSNVEVIRARAEELGQRSSHRETFDVAVARAVAEMRTLAEYCLPLVRVGGLFVAAKGHDPQDEVIRAERSIKLMGASLLPLCIVESVGPFGQRTAVVCVKSRHTPKRYPRSPGTPTKSPL